MILGDKVRFKDPTKYDDKEHVILNVQKLPNDTCYFLHYWSWIDEDELVLVENMSKVKVGDYFDDGTLSQIIRIDGDRAYYDEINSVPLDYAYHRRTNVVEDKKEDAVVSPSHYTTTKISALDVVNDWELDFYLGNTLKYMKRYKLKGNPLQDLKKAAQYLQLKIELIEKDGNTIK